MQRDSDGFTLIELMIVVAIIAILASIAIPSILRSRISANQTSAVASLDTIFKMNTQFRSSDMDNNGRNDYWAENVWGLYGVKSAGGDRVELFSKSVAEADYEGAGDFSSSSPAGASFSIDASFQVGDETPKSGYYVSMFAGESSSGTTCSSSDAYTANGDNSGGSLSGSGNGDDYRSHYRFSVSAFPSLYNNTGTKAYVIDEGGDKFELDAKATDGIDAAFNGNNAGSDNDPNASPGTAPNECLPSEDALNGNWGTIG